ncbi:hypothetical protein ODR17_25110 [Escherichia coli]|nr:hypothetical protein [Escherichia coli]
MDNRTITLQELLEYMSMLRDDMNALTVAFSYLASSLPKEQMIQILAFIHFESNNSRWSSEQQKSFKWLASHWRAVIQFTQTFLIYHQRTTSTL